MKEITSKNLTNRELAMLIKSNQETNLLQHQSIIDSLNEFHKVTSQTLSEIVTQTKKTNGNVMDLLLWRMYIKGQMWTVPIFVGAFISGVVAIAFNYFKGQ